MVVMGKAQNEVPIIDSPQSDASSLLAAALQQMDGIISDLPLGPREDASHPLEQFARVGLEGVERSPGVELAAERLVNALQAYPVLPPPPDPHKANILRLWIQQDPSVVKMVRGGGGRYVAATVALIEKQQIKVQNSDTQPKDNVESMDDSTLKCNSSTDSGKDDHSLITSTSSTSSNSNEDLDSICCKNDFQWVVKNENGEKKSERGRERKQPEVRMRKASASLDRKRVSRRERDYKCRSTSSKYHSPTRHHDCCHDYRPYCDYNNSQIHDFRIPYFYRAPPPPLPCEYPPYRYVSKPTNELQEQLRRFESDKESLSLQVAVLTDQVEAQAEKIADLERTISEQKRQISISGDLLQREMLTRSSLETQKLELLAVVSEMKRHESQIEKDNIELRDRLAEEKRKHKPPLAPRNHIYPTSSTPTNFSDPRMSPSPSPLSITHSSRKLDYTDSSTPTQQKISVGGQYRSLPRDQSESAALRRAVVFGRPTEHPRCSSVPNLADTETVVINQKDGETYSKEPSPSMQSGAPKGIRKIFGKMKRSNSGNLDDIPSDEPFTRGGVRSTAGPRLCGNSPVVKNDKPFCEWTSDEVINWMKEMGIENISQDVKKWIQNGQTLLSAQPQEIDKELNIKHSLLLRKKLHLALEAERGISNGDPFLECAGRLEPGWVLRWLDDIGLPQYKANFMASRLDGRVLHRLTMDDLQSLHITLALHLASVRTGIQVLRKKKFDPHCLVRRSDPENETDDSVELWTNHRVMEWLRVVDLAEYAPNLRGSGVHGALMVHEDRFTDTLLASLLSIPSEKTLLRRHLSTHFKQLLGTENIQKKREAEATLGYIPLTVNLKIKLSKKSQFTLKRKKSKYDIEEGELVCPLNDSKGSQSTTGDSSPDLGKSPNHVAASPDKSSITSQVSGGKKKNERISDV